MEGETLSDTDQPTKPLYLSNNKAHTHRFGENIHRFSFSAFTDSTFFKNIFIYGTAGVDVCAKQISCFEIMILKRQIITILLIVIMRSKLV